MNILKAPRIIAREFVSMGTPSQVWDFFDQWAERFSNLPAGYVADVEEEILARIEQHLQRV